MNRLSKLTHSGAADVLCILRTHPLAVMLAIEHIVGPTLGEVVIMEVVVKPNADYSILLCQDD